MTAPPNEVCIALDQHIAREAHAMVIEYSSQDQVLALINGLGLNWLESRVQRAIATAIGPVVIMPPQVRGLDRSILIAHECEHVHQFWTHGLEYAWLYTFELEKRAAYEAEAYGAQLELQHMLTGQLPSLDALVQPLELDEYGFKPEHKALARDLLITRATSIINGVYTSFSANRALDWLNQHAATYLHDH